MGPKTLPTIWGTYMKLVTKYQIPVVNSCLEKCDEKCAYYMFNVYKNQQSVNRKQESDGSKNASHNMVYLSSNNKTLNARLLCRDTSLSQELHYCNQVYLYDTCDQISDFCHQQLLRKMRRKISWTDGRTEGWTEVKQHTPSPFGERGYKKVFHVRHYLKKKYI